MLWYGIYNVGLVRPYNTSTVSVLCDLGSVTIWDLRTDLGVITMYCNWKRRKRGRVFYSVQYCTCRWWGLTNLGGRKSGTAFKCGSCCWLQTGRRYCWLQTLLLATAGCCCCYCQCCANPSAALYAPFIWTTVQWPSGVGSDGGGSGGQDSPSVEHPTSGLWRGPHL